jgi:hypothetical protein
MPKLKQDEEKRWIYQEFWKLVKKENKCYPQDRRPAPSVKFYVEEQSVKIKEGAYRHQFFAPDGSKLSEMTSYCGYDRGPKRYNRIQRHIDEMEIQAKRDWEESKEWDIKED